MRRTLRVRLEGVNDAVTRIDFEDRDLLVEFLEHIGRTLLHQWEEIGE